MKDGKEDFCHHFITVLLNRYVGSSRSYKELKIKFRIDIYKLCGKRLDYYCNIFTAPITPTLKLLL